LDTNNRR